MHLKTKQSGVSLAETLIALTLMGSVLVPIIMFSSAWFMKGIASDRRRMAVSCGVSQFLNRLGVDLQQVRLILPTSTATALYYAYYDPLRDAEVRRGFRLTTVSGAQVLERLEYNESNGTWTSISPYADSPANDIRVNAGATFEYCTISTCGVSTSQAMSVRLSGWTMAHRQDASQTLTLPTAQFALSPGPVGVPLVSDTPRLLFSRTASESFGSGASLDISFLSGNESVFQNLTFGAFPVSYVLFAISASTLVVDEPRDRIFFGEDASPGCLWVWNRSTGLSTLLTTGKYPGAASMVVDSALGRAYWGEYDGYTNTGKFYTWSDSSGLSTLTSGRQNPGFFAVNLDQGRNRVYWGEENWSNTGSFYTWSPGSGLSTIISNRYAPGYFATYLNSSSGDLFFCNWGQSYHRWTPSSGLSTIWSGSNWGCMATAFVGSNAYFYNNDTASVLRIWTPSSGVSTASTTTLAGRPSYIRSTPQGWLEHIR